MYDETLNFFKCTKHITKIVIEERGSEDLSKIIISRYQRKLVYDFDVNQVGQHVDIEDANEIYNLI